MIDGLGRLPDVGDRATVTLAAVLDPDEEPERLELVVLELERHVPSLVRVEVLR